MKSNDLNKAGALVVFSGGQDSTTCLAWALDRYEQVETVGFDYGQVHSIEMSVRHTIRDQMAALRPAWRAKLGPDHVHDAGVIGQISQTRLTGYRDSTSKRGASRYVCSRQESIVPYTGGCFSLSPRAQAHRYRSLRNRFLGISGLPRRYNQGPSGGDKSRHSGAICHPYPAHVDRQGTNL